MSTPRINERPSFAQRDAYKDVLSHAYAEGRLDDAEFEARLARLDRASSLQGMETQIDDLPRGDLPRPQGAKPGRTAPVRGMSWKPVLAVCVGTGAVAGFLLAGGLGLMGLGGAAVADEQEAPDPQALIDDHLDTMPTEFPPSYEELSDVIETARELGPEVSEIYLYDSGTAVEVPVRGGGDRYDIAYIPRGEGEVTTTPGGAYAPGAKDGELFDSSDLDPAVLVEMLTQAPEVLAAETGVSGSLPENVFVRLDPGGTQYVGVEQSMPLVEVSLGSDAYGVGGGSVTWTADGATLVEVDAG